MLMTHGDDKGVVFPPTVAPIQIVIIPIAFKKNKDMVMNYVNKIYKILTTNTDLRVHIDNSNKKPGWKYNYWETNGTPMKLEIGPRDMNSNCLIASIRHTFEKIKINTEDPAHLINEITKHLNSIQQELYNNAKNNMKKSIIVTNRYENLLSIVNNKEMCLVPFCGKIECEETIKQESGSKSLCIPDDHNYDEAGLLYQYNTFDHSACIKCGSNDYNLTLFGKSY
jgi:prolyl-tRNA synthetase